MERALASILLGLGLLFAGAAQASSARCEGCTDAQFKTRAIALGEGQHVITSFSTNKIKMFNVRETSGGEPGVPPRWIATAVAISADMQSVFNDGREFYVATAGTMKAVVVVRGIDLGVPGLTSTTTAYDVLRDFNLREQLGDRLATGTLPGWANLDRAGEQIVQGLFAVIGASDASIEVTVEFSDGSTVVYKLNTNAGTGQYQVNRSRTKNNQAIPESNSPEYQGTWGGSDQPALANHMSGLGAIVTYTGAGGGYGSMTCTWVGTTLTCRLQKK